MSAEAGPATATGDRPAGPPPARPGPRRALSGAVWSAFGFGAQGVAQLVLLAVLGRLLTPADFGVVTATLVIVNLGRLCTQAVIGAALVQRPRLDDGHVRAAFALALVTGAIAALLMVALAPVAASFFSMPRLAGVVRALSVLFVAQAFSIVPQGLLERELNFRAVAVVEGTAHLIGFAGAGVVAGVMGAGIWALVIGYVGLGLVHAVAMVSIRRHPVLPRFSRRELGELLYFGGGLLGGRFFNYVALQGDNLVVARQLPASDLGAYGRAYQLVAMPAMLIGQVLDRVLFPLFSRIQSERTVLAEQYRRGVSMVLALATPVSVVVAVAASEIVRVVLGDGWQQVIWPLRVLACGLAGRTAYKVSDTLSRAVGVVYSRAGRQAAYAALVLGGAVAGLPWGITGVSVGVAGAIVVNHIVMAELCLRQVPLGWPAFVGAHARAAVLAAVLAPLAFGTRAVVGPAAPDLVTLATVVAVTFGATAVLTFVWPLAGTRELRWLTGELRAWAADRGESREVSRG